MLAKLRKGVADFQEALKATPTQKQPVEQFKDLWADLQAEHDRILQQNTNLDDPRLLGKTHIPRNLDAMVNLLVREDLGLLQDTNRGISQGIDHSEIGENHTGPLRACLEYTLENRVFIDLCAKGFADRPQGMMSLILITLNQLVERLRHPIIPYKTAHAPLSQLIRVSAEVGSPAAQERLVVLLRTLWIHMRRDPTQLQFFYAANPMQKGNQNEKLDLFNALLPHVMADSEIGERARHAILCVSSIADPYLHEYVVQRTNFCKILALGLVRAYEDAVSTRRNRDRSAEQEDGLSRARSASRDAQGHKANPADLAVLEADRVLATRWKFALALSTPGIFAGIDFDEEEEQGQVDEDLQAEEGLSAKQDERQDVKDKLHLKLLSNTVVREISDVFITGPVRSGLLETHEDTVRDNMLAVCVLLESAVEAGSGTAMHGPLQWKLVSMLISPSLSPDLRSLDQGNDKLGQQDAAGLEDARLQTELLVCIDSMSPHLSTAALKLFSALLDLNDARILHSLILRQLYSGYHLQAAPDGTPPPPNPLRTPPRSQYEKPSRSAARLGHPRSTGNAIDFLDKYPGSPRPPVTNSKHKVNTMTDQELKDLVTFESYLTDEQAQAAARLAAYTSPMGSSQARSCSPRKLKPSKLSISIDTNPPSFGTTDGAGVTSGATTPDFTEGLFLTVLLNKLERMLDSSLEENLLLTGILAKLAQCPHRVIHSYLYEESIPVKDFRAAFDGRPYEMTTFDAEQGDTLLSIKPNVRTLANALATVWKEAQERAQDLEPEFKQHHEWTRLQLGADGEFSPDIGADHGLLKVLSGSSDFGPSKQRFVRAYVVVEEFLKELASILQAKQNLACLQLDLQ